MAQHIDILPTLCELTGVPLPQRQLDGRSLAPLLKSGTGVSPHDYTFHQWNRGHSVVQSVAGDPELKASWAIRNAQGQKLLMTGELYDLSKDPGETQDIAALNPAVVRDLRAHMEDWFADVTRGQNYARVTIQVGREGENPVEVDLT